MWESFAGDQFNPAGSRSHIMYGGGIGMWFYSGILGLDTVATPQSPAFQNIIVRPDPAAGTKMEKKEEGRERKEEKQRNKTRVAMVKKVQLNQAGVSFLLSSFLFSQWTCWERHLGASGRVLAL